MGEETFSFVDHQDDVEDIVGCLGFDEIIYTENSVGFRINGSHYADLFADEDAAFETHSISLADAIHEVIADASMKVWDSSKLELTPQNIAGVLRA